MAEHQYIAIDIEQVIDYIQGTKRWLPKHIVGLIDKPITEWTGKEICEAIRLMSNTMPNNIYNMLYYNKTSCDMSRGQFIIEFYPRQIQPIERNNLKIEEE